MKRNISLLLIIFTIFILTLALGACGDDDKYDDVFNKDPNTWTEDEKDYVDGFFEWQKEQNK